MKDATTIGIDLAKSVSRSTALMRQESLWFVGS